jgi:protein deglycase
MKKVVVFLAEGFEEIEAITVVDVLRRGGVQCDTCSIKTESVTGAHGITVSADFSLDGIDFRQYDGIILPGGMPGAENLRNSIRVVELIKEFYQSGRITAAICAAPIVLAEAGIVNGRKITSYPAFKDKLANCIYCEESVVVDGGIVTSRGPATAIAFSLKLLEVLGLNEEAEALREGMLVNYVEDVLIKGN